MKKILFILLGSLFFLTAQEKTSKTPPAIKCVVTGDEIDLDESSAYKDGKVYFCIARAFEKGIEKHGMPKSFVSIGLGCDVKYAKDLIYSEGMDIQNKKLQTPIGVSCRICPRIECQQRAFPPIDKELKLDINFRGTSPYVTL